MRRVYIYFSCDWPNIKRIQERFGLPTCVNINGETCEAAEIRDEDWELLKETERRGYIQIRTKK